MKKIILTLTLFLLSTTLFAQAIRVNRFQEKTKVKIKSSKLGKNIISFSPIQYYNGDVANDGGNLAVGINYERIFNNELLSVKMPINFILNRPGIFLQPTIKFYPKKQGIAKYAVGPQFLISHYESFYNTYSGVGGFFVKYEMRSQFGFGINNSINFTVSKHLYAAMEATIGILYYDSFNKENNNNYYNGSSNNVTQTIHIGCSLGYRF